MLSTELEALLEIIRTTVVELLRGRHALFGHITPQAASSFVPWQLIDCIAAVTLPKGMWTPLEIAIYYDYLDLAKSIIANEEEWTAGRDHKRNFHRTSIADLAAVAHVLLGANTWIATDSWIILGVRLPDISRSKVSLLLFAAHQDIVVQSSVKLMFTSALRCWYLSICSGRRISTRRLRHCMIVAVLSFGLRRGQQRCNVNIWC